ncbi:hypothetical protein E2C01_074183 [Portunus trituberculatus]|uniref:Uncharacterized protein n=1 Tax=Portunus trituberculatus TaxID=210409 RepID=A0A5B7ICK7_PORTR|nr:hypothetical protein [Portunus trituberculatus]
MYSLTQFSSTTAPAPLTTSISTVTITTTTAAAAICPTPPAINSLLLSCTTRGMLILRNTNETRNRKRRCNAVTSEGRVRCDAGPIPATESHWLRGHHLQEIAMLQREEEEEEEEEEDEEEDEVSLRRCERNRG